MKKLLKIFVVVVLLLTIIVGVYNIRAGYYLRDYLKELPISPTTGYVEGIEPLTIPAVGEPRAGVLMVHGFIGSPQDFGSLGQFLADNGCEVRMTVLPGHCRNPLELEQVEEEDLFAHVQSEIRLLKTLHEKVIVVAFSMGSAISAVAASREGVDGVVLLAPYFKVTPQWYYVLPPEMWNRMLSPVMPYVIKWELVKGVNDLSNFGKNFTYEVIPTKFVLTLDKVGEVARSAETLGALKCPVLVMMGKDDVTAFPEAAEAAFGEIGSADKEFIWLPRSNHIVCLDYDRAEVHDRAAKFIARIAGER